MAFETAIANEWIAVVARATVESKSSCVEIATDCVVAIVVSDETPPLTAAVTSADDNSGCLSEVGALDK